MSKVLNFVRASFYYSAFFVATIIHSILCVLIARWLPFEPRFRFVTSLNYFYVFWIRFCCGINVKVEGLENLPKDGAYVVIANHQSEWETIYFQILIRPHSIVLKQELLKIPFFGWALALLEPIALDRSQKRGALKQLLGQGKNRLERGVPVIIFPQGTRLPSGEVGVFNKGGAMLAASAGVPLVPMAHNAGFFWPGKRFMKKPGTITLRIGKPIATQGSGVSDIHTESVDWLKAQMQELDQLG
ncbi:MAG: 1-acyl-sn-glycerol-3-phosphate acyltransferase [Oceanospirillaceae bacterium]|nr:1-acyl-sn-glycerol-3-phosphate acyltransferase [Oceanospirillaceae bacterium]